jgi:hypothetical protein
VFLLGFRKCFNKLTAVYFCPSLFVMIDLGAVRSNQNVSLMEVDDQEWLEQQCNDASQEQV